MLESGNIPTGNQFLGHLGIGITQLAAQLSQQGLVGTVNAKGSRTRTGTITQLNAEFTQSIDDRVVETSIIPTMRSRVLIVRATGMRPSTKLNIFFDDVDVAQYAWGLREIIAGPITGEFTLYEEGVVDDEDNPARSYSWLWVKNKSLSDPSQAKGMVIDRGDVLKVFNGTVDTGATAIVVDIITQKDALGVDELAIKLLGTKSSSSFNWEIPPSDMSAYVAKSASGNAQCSILGVRMGSGIRTNSSGAAHIAVVIPNNANHKFNTGTVMMKLSDDATNNDGLATTTSQANFTSAGTLQVKDRTITNVRNAGDIVTSKVSQTQAINQTLFIAGRGDPLAQTFTLSEAGGAFITMAEVYFSVKDPVLPVRCELRSVVNGYPGPDVIARKSLNPSKVNVSLTSLVATQFVFDTPVYLMPGQEYCVVLLSDSTIYRVYISRMGENIIGTNQLITAQPSLGSLFKSQNNSTWTAEQFDDLTFKLYKAKFDISAPANIDFVNKRLPTVKLSDNAFYAVAGTNNVRVFHPNHGFVDGDTVILNGVYVGPTGPFAALGTTYLSGSLDSSTKGFIVGNIEYDFYTIDITNASGAAVNAAFTTQFGGADGEATYHIAYSTMFPNIQIQDFPESSSVFSVKTMKGDSVNAYNFLNEAEVGNRQNIHFTSMMMIASHENESKRLAKEKSLKFKVVLNSTDENLSPMIDSQRCSMILVNNKINNPTLANMNYETFDNVTICTAKTVSFLHVHSGDPLSCNSYFETTDTTLFDDFDKIIIGKHVKVTSGINNGFVFKAIRAEKVMVGVTETYRVYVDGTNSFVDGTDTSCTLVLHNRYIDEIAPYNTSTLSTYVSQAMRTAVASTGVRITLDANIPTGTMIDVYHRSMVANSLIPLHEQCWRPIASTATITTTADFATFTEYMFEKTGLPSHDVSQVKVVFRSDNPALTPRISALRMIALA